MFAPKLAQDLVSNSFEFLDKELIQLLDIGELKEIDLLIKCKMKSKEVFLEPQADSRKWSLERMFLYTMRIFERHRLPIDPMALLTWDTPKKPVEDQLGSSFSDLDVMSFRFRTIQLNRINWQTFLMQDNPVAAVLMSISPERW